MAARSGDQESSSEVEILVHIGAPALGPDDARYRAQAAAYNNFRPATQIPIQLRGGQASSKSSDNISDTQLSFEGADDNLNSPPLAPGEAAQDDPELQASFVSLASEVPDSQPDQIEAFAKYMSPSRVLEFYTSSLDNDSGSYTGFASSQSPSRAAIEKVKELNRRRLLPRSTRRDYQPLTRLLPGSQGSPTNPREGRSVPEIHENEDENEDEDEDEADSTQASKSRTTSRALFQRTRPRQKYALNAIEPSDTDGDDDPPPAAQKRKKSPQTSSSQSPDAKKQRTGDAAPGSNETDGNGDDEYGDEEDEAYESLTRIQYPPGPEIAESVSAKKRLADRYADMELNPATMVIGPPPSASIKDIKPYHLQTAALVDVMTTLDVASRYRPVTVARKIHDFERGYWLVDTRSWSDRLRRGCWNFMSEYIEKGLAGWGVMAVRNEDFTWLRLYGWGSLVSEMYMLLYLWSQRAVRDAGLKWYDTKNKVVITMPQTGEGGPQGDLRRKGGPQKADDPPTGGDIGPGASAEELVNVPEIPMQPANDGDDDGFKTPPMGQGSPFVPQPQQPLASSSSTGQPADEPPSLPSS